MYYKISQLIKSITKKIELYFSNVGYDVHLTKFEPNATLVHGEKRHCILRLIKPNDII